ncbi:MAG: hypothetical protein ACI81L_002238 [Verrucomicrobiales bacterium]|jgi:uncharacterized protein (DUF58 family)
MSAPTTSSTTPEELLHRLDWEVLQRLDGRLQGDYRTLFLGDGLDVADLRDYQPDDDVRRIDWNVTARMDKPFVRQYDEHRDLTAWFLIDRSASMQFGHTERSKEIVVAELVTALARLLSHRGNRVGAMLWNNAVESLIAPRTGRPQVLRLARQLLSPSTPTNESTTLTGLLHAGAGVARRRSLIFVVSDFVCEPGWDVALRRLAARHEVIAIRIVDAQELSLPNAGLVVVQDAETGEQMTVDTGNQAFRARFGEAAEAREQRISDASKRAGIELFEISTDDDLARALLQMIAQRKGRRRR